MAGFLVQAASFVAQIGASYLLGRFLAQDGPRAESDGARNGDYGVPMPRVYGEAVRITCPYMAQGEFEETEHKVEDYSEVVGAISGAAAGFLIAGPVGAVVGAVAGQAIEEAVTRKHAQEINVRLDDGSSVTITQEVSTGLFMDGDRVRVINGGGNARVAMATN